jgi:hypothetical protein
MLKGLRRGTLLGSLGLSPCGGSLTTYSDSSEGQHDRGHSEKSGETSSNHHVHPNLHDDSDSIKLKHDQSQFMKAYPEYASTSALDVLRERDYTRLKKSGEVYVDYMGGSLYPESLVAGHLQVLQESTFGNTHSINPT